MALTVAEIKVRISGDMDDLRRDLAQVPQLARQSAQQTASAAQEGATAQQTAARQVLATEQQVANARRQIMDEVGRASTLAGGAILAGLGAATKTAADFDQAMRNVNSVAKLGDTDFQNLRKSVMGVAADPQIRQGPKDLATALYDIQGAGFTGKRGLDILRVSAMGASAGMTDTKTASTALTSILKSGVPGITSTQQAMDLMFRAVDKGKFNFAELAGSIGQVLPDAAAMGISFQEIAAHTIVATNQGQTFAGSINDLANLIVKIKNPSKESEAEFQRLGISYGAAALQAKGLSGIIEEVRVKTHGQKDALSRLFPDMQANRAITTDLSSSGRNYAAALRDVSDAQATAGSTQGALTEQNKGAGSSWELFRKDLERTGIVAGDTFLPALGGVLKSARELMEMFQRLTPVQQEWGVKLAAAGGALLLVVPRVMDAVRAFTLLRTAMAGAGAASAASSVAGAGGAGAAGGGILARLGVMGAGVGTAAAGTGALMSGGAGAGLMSVPGLGWAAAALAAGGTAGVALQDSLDLWGNNRAWRGKAKADADRDRQQALLEQGLAARGMKLDASGKPVRITDEEAGGGFSGMPTRTGAGETIQPTSDAKRKLTESEKQATAFAKELAGAQRELNELQRGGSTFAADLAEKYGKVSPALRAQRVALEDAKKAFLDHQEAQRKAAQVQADFARGNQEGAGKLRDLQAQLAGTTTSLEYLRAKFPGVTDAELRHRVALEAKEKALNNQIQVQGRFSQALESQKAAEADAVAALKGEGDSIERLRALYPGVTEAKLRDLAASKQSTATAVAQKKAAEDLAEAQKRASEQAVEAKKREQEQVASWFAEQKAAIADLANDSGFGRAIARFGGAMSPGQQTEARALFSQREDEERARKARDEMEKLRGTLAASGSPFSLASVAASTFGQSLDTLGDKARAALGPLADLMRQAAESDLLRKAAQATNQAQAQLQSTVSGNPLFALRAQNPGISDAALRQLAGQQSAQNSANWQNQMLQGRNQTVMGQWNQIAQQAMGGITPYEQHDLDFARYEMSQEGPPKNEAERQARLKKLQDLMPGSVQGMFGFGGSAGGDAASSSLQQVAAGMDSVSQSSKGLAMGLGGGSGGEGGLTTNFLAVSTNAATATTSLSSLVEMLGQLGPAAAAAMAILATAIGMAQAGAGAPGASPAQAAQDAGRRQALAVDRGG